MKFEYRGNDTLIIVREDGDPKYYGVALAAGESKLLYAIKNELNRLGCDLIKKRMHKDGHLVDDLHQYLRVRSNQSPGPHICLHNPSWAMDGIESSWNENGECGLQVTFDYFTVHGSSLADKEALKRITWREEL